MQPVRHAVIPALLIFLTPLSFLAAPAQAQFSPSTGAQPSGALSLDDCYQASLKRSELIAGQEELIVQAEEHYRQAVGGVLPAVNGVASYLVQAPGSTSTFSPDTQPFAKLGLSQPLFRGFREFAGLRQTKSLVRTQEFAKRAAEAVLYRDVAQAFYSVLSIEQDQRNLVEEQKAYGERVKELKSRYGIGRSRLSEVLTVESAVASLESLFAILQSQLIGAREVLAFLTGLTNLTGPLAGQPLRAENFSEPGGKPQEGVAPLDTFLVHVNSRPDVQTEKERAVAAEESVSVASGAHLPSVDLLGNYYLYRTGSNQNVPWDVQAILTLPIYAGGAIASRTREAESLARQADLSLSRVKRFADQEIRTLHAQLGADHAQIKALERSVDLAHKNHLEQTREYRLGLATNLDAIQALTAFEETQRALNRTQYALKLDEIKMEVATGRKPVPTATP